MSSKRYAEEFKIKAVKQITSRVRLGKKMHVPEKRVPRFKPGVELLERVNIKQVQQKGKLVA